VLLDAVPFEVKDESPPTRVVGHPASCGQVDYPFPSGRGPTSTAACRVPIRTSSHALACRIRKEPELDTRTLAKIPWGILIPPLGLYWILTREKTRERQQASRRDELKPVRQGKAELERTCKRCGRQWYISQVDINSEAAAKAAGLGKVAARMGSAPVVPGVGATRRQLKAELQVSRIEQHEQAATSPARVRTADRIPTTSRSYRSRRSLRPETGSPGSCRSRLHSWLIASRNAMGPIPADPSARGKCSRSEENPR
jgi:hypothetical protein